MAKEYATTERFDATGQELWDATLRCLDATGFRVEPNQASWTITAKPSMASAALTGSTNLTVRIYEGTVECHSESWPRTVLFDYGKNRRSVEALLQGIGLDLAGVAASEGSSMLSKARERFEGIADDVANASTFASGRQPQRVGEDCAGTPRAPREDVTPVTGATADAESLELARVMLHDSVLETVNTDECPLDNSHGASELRVEQEFSQSLTVGVSTTRDRVLEGKLGGKFFDLVSAELAAHAKQSLGVRVETTITRTYRATFVVPPHSRTMYRVTWRRRRQPGTAAIELGSETFTIPFSIISDLEYAVSTHEFASE